MFNENYGLAMEIRRKILSRFINADINIIFDKEQDEYFISTRNEELYYSEKYGQLVFEINQSILWGQGIFNFYFILDRREREFSEIVKEVSFSLQAKIPYTSWNIDDTAVHRLSVDRHINMNNSSLAA